MTELLTHNCVHHFVCVIYSLYCKETPQKFAYFLLDSAKFDNQ